jgi:hypothetical protein
MFAVDALNGRAVGDLDFHVIVGTIVGDLNELFEICSACMFLAVSYCSKKVSFVGSSSQL